MKKINQLDRARIAWQELVKVARMKTTITYGGLGARMNVHPRAIRFFLSPIQDYCMNAGLPPLTILVVNGGGKPGQGFVAHDHTDLDNGFEKVWTRAWDEEPNPFEFASGGSSYEELIESLLNQPDGSGEIYALVKVRGIQQILFRDAVYRAYSGTCAFTGISIPEAVEACHIVPWSSSNQKERMDVRNGILLNPLHHRLFDFGYLTISSDYKILYDDPEGKNGSYSNIEAAVTRSIHNMQMKIPRIKRLRPLEEYIERHNKLIGWDEK